VGDETESLMRERFFFFIRKPLLFNLVDLITVVSSPENGGLLTDPLVFILILDFDGSALCKELFECLFYNTLPNLLRIFGETIPELA
jgi:hypothetical protein